MPDSNDVVLYEVQEGIAEVTLNRPNALNAWIPELGRAYFDRLEEADSSPDVRAIVVTGAGRGFCAGVDFGHLKEFTKEKLRPTTTLVLRACHCRSISR